MLQKIYHSLPIQLLLLNLKKNRVILILWFLLFLIITGNFAKSYGVPYLFLDPEYLSTVDFWSLYMVGLSFGIFTMSYNITIYILESYRFQFLMVQHDPFTKFCLNNSFFPITFIITYCVSFFKFQITQGYQDVYIILKELSGFLVGFSITVLLTFAYFRISGSAIFKRFTQNINDSLRQRKMTRVSMIQKIKMVKRKNYHTDYFLDFPFIIKKVDHFIPYDKLLVNRVIDQNHLNAVLLQITVFVLLLLMGLFRDNVYFQIPASGSMLILASIIAMVLGASAYWLKGWSMYIAIALVFAFNFALKQNWINPEYQVFGLNYSTSRADYSFERIQSLSSDQNIQNDYNHTIKLLDNWKSKFDSTQKPKIIFVCTSGGGQRAAVWTMRTLQVADSITQNRLMNHTICMTGASGGLIGASYYRELYLRKKLGEPIFPYENMYLKNISKDMLNPLVFTLVINDLFVRYQHFSDGKYSYIKDRGFAFENQLNINTNFVMNRKIKEYGKYEFDGTIPMLMLTPSVVNDGRKLYVSPQPISYMNTEIIENKDILKSKYMGIEFMRFFKDQDAENLGFVSGLRMSATFPYITPNINLPSSPSMEIMDAGLSDNYGIAEAVRFSFVFRDWINKNTGGVVFVCVRDSPKLIPVEKKKSISIFDRILNPIGALYANWDWLQDNNNEYYLEYAHSFLKTKMDVVEFQYSPIPEGWHKTNNTKKQNDELILKTWQERASLNWHLTQKEKQSLEKSIFESENKLNLDKLESLLKSE